MKNRTRRLLYGLAVILALAGVLALILIKGPLAPLQVTATQLQKGDLQSAVFGIGTLQARRSYVIGPTRAGRLLRLAVDHGDTVTAGQLLGEMDPVDLPARLKSAGLTVEKTEHLVIAAQARLDEARERARLAHKEARRYRDLVAQKQVTQEAADTRESDARAAADQVRAAEADLAGIRHDLGRSHAEVTVIKDQLRDLQLLSPVDGLVTARDVEPGSVITAGTPVLRLIEPGSLWVRARVDQASSGGLALGQKAVMHLRSDPRQALAGQVARIELIADSLTEERWVDVAFDRPPPNMAIGMLAQVTFEMPAVKNVAWLPAAALRRQDGESGVWRIVDERVRFAPVQTGVRTLDGKVEIRAGLSADDDVVVYTARRLQVGQRVKVSAHD